MLLETIGRHSQINEELSQISEALEQQAVQLSDEADNLQRKLYRQAEFTYLISWTHLAAEALAALTDKSPTFHVCDISSDQYTNAVKKGELTGVARDVRDWLIRQGFEPRFEKCEDNSGQFSSESFYITLESKKEVVERILREYEASQVG